MILRRWFWLMVGLIILIVFLVWLFQDTYGFEIPKEPALYFLTSDSTLWIIQEDKVQKVSLTEIDKEYLLENFRKASSLKIAGDYIGLAGGTIITAGEIASFALPPFAPFIQIATRAFGGLMALIGGIFRFTAKDLQPELLPARLILFSDTQNKFVIQNSPTVLILTYAPFSFIQQEKLVVDGYLLVFGDKKPVGGLRPKWIEIAAKESFLLEVVTIGGMGVYLPGITHEYTPVIILERVK